MIAIGQNMESFLMPNKTLGPRKHPQNWTVWLQHYFFPNPDIESSLYQNWKEILSSWQIRKTDKTQKAQVCYNTFGESNHIIIDICSRNIQINLHIHVNFHCTQRFLKIKIVWVCTVCIIKQNSFPILGYLIKVLEIVIVVPNVFFQFFITVQWHLFLFLMGVFHTAKNY